MSLLIAAYSKSAYKEFVLPNVMDADYSIILNKDLFKIGKDVILDLETISGEWHFKQKADYRMEMNGSAYFGDALKDTDVILVDLMNGRKISLLVVECSSPFSAAHKYTIDYSSVINIGTDKRNHIQYDFRGLVSRNHAVIRRRGDKFVIEDQSANGIFVGSSRITREYELKFGDCINIFGLRIVFMESVIALYSYGEMCIDENVLHRFNAYSGIRTADAAIPMTAEENKFHRSPRNIYKLNDESVEIEAPPQPRPFVRKPVMLTIGPSFTMALPMVLGCLLAISSMKATGGSAGAFMYTGIVTAVGSAILGVIWALMNLKYEKKEYKREEDERFRAYSDYLIEQTENIRSKYEENKQILANLYPDAHICKTYDENCSMLWNRNMTHSDFLHIRMGIGDMPFQMPINVPKEKFTIQKDGLASKPRMIHDNYCKLKDVPINVDLLTHNLIGVVGNGTKETIMPLIYNMVIQIAANHCYTDVKMAFIYNEMNGDAAEEWNFARWLPHVWSEDKKSRYVASNKTEAGDVFYELTSQLRARLEEGETKKETIFKPRYILFVENPALLENELISKYVYEHAGDVGLTTILMANGFDELPNTCEYIIQANEMFCGVYSVHDDDAKTAIKFDRLTQKETEGFARNISGIEVNEMETGGEIPNSLEFFEMHKVSTLEQFKVLERWRKNRTFDTMRVLIGQKTGREDCYLDIHEKYHGPHGLIAGTTGSGKSETLQTYMLSLAINYSPFDVAFFIIDFKGGGMANLFSDLPHTIGQISNLSGNQVRRAMISIKSENMRRQRLFGDFGVNHINGYSRLLKNGEATVPVPHLFIIIDEFAELKREEPEFMRELISVAQVGRSLGVHLILATQKPSGTVDDNIWSNAKFRLCLRVQDRQDSNDMLHKPDAAYITQAGRCYMQVGNDEVFELFQSGWSGATYRENSTAIKSELTKMFTLTGKAALVGSRTVMRERMLQRTNWLISIAEALNSTALSMNTTIENCQEDPDEFAQFLTNTFDVLRKMHIDYPDTLHNRRCLQDMVQVWNLLYAEDMNMESIVKAIVRQANLLGMKLPEMKEKTQLDAVVEHLKNVAQNNGYINHQKLWLPVLPEYILLEELADYKANTYSDGKWPEKGKAWNLDAMVGLYDDPVNQSQKPLVIDLAQNGHHAVCGTVVSGKSTFLQTMIYSFINSYSPDALNIYILDYSSKMLSAFEKAPHVGGVIYENDHEKTQKFFYMMNEILEERKNALRGGSYSQYIQKNPGGMPAIMVVIDNIAGFREKTGDKYEENLMRLLRDGAGYGIFMFISAAGFSGTEIPNRLGDNIRTVVCLDMGGDKFKYADVMHTMKIDVLPEEGVRGRGLALVNGNLLEFHTALALSAEDDYQRSEEINKVCCAMSEEWQGAPVRKIPEIPEKPVWAQFSELTEYRKCIEEGRRLPVAYNQADASVYGIDLATTYCYIIQGKARTGKTNLLKNVLASAMDFGGEICVMDDNANSMQYAENTEGVKCISTAADMYQYWMDLVPVFRERNARKKELMETGLEGKELFEAMHNEFKPIWILVANYADFINQIYMPSEANMGSMSGFMENIIEKGSTHNIYFIGTLNPDDAPMIMGYKVFNLVADYRCGVHLGGNVAGQRIFDFSTISFSEQTKMSKAGIGLVPSGELSDTHAEIVIPLYGGKKNERHTDL